VVVKLKDKVAIVTGSGRGIGRAIAIAFAQEGADLALAARTREQLETVSKVVEELGRRAITIPTDVSDRSSIRTMVDQVLKTFGTVDILVNNAGVGSSANPKPLVEYDDEFWDYSLAVNLTSAYICCKAVLPAMLKKKAGSIINTASVAGKIGLVHGCAYSATKHGLIGLTRSIALEVAIEGIRVNAICPGPVRTDMFLKRMKYDEDLQGASIEDQERSYTPMGRILDPMEIAPLAVYLASDDSGAMTGQAITISGGMLMY
jgi:NAD(P)-dependent dehydrogenase (short-subunit alcohol dehydrogenase family)